MNNILLFVICDFFLKKNVSLSALYGTNMARACVFNLTSLIKKPQKSTDSQKVVWDSLILVTKWRTISGSRVKLHDRSGTCIP